MSKSIAKKFNFISLLQFALPSMIMMVFMSLYTIVDGIFVSRLLGSQALSATNIVYPVLNVLIAVGVMLATGGSAIIARKIGEKQEQAAREDFTMLVTVGVLFGAVAMIAGNIGITPLVRMLGATEKILSDSTTYLSVLLFFAPACMLQLLFQSFFVTAGKPGMGLTVIIFGGITNAVLDYVLMGPLQMGIAGAAIATGAGQVIPAAAGLIYFSVIKKELYFVKPKLKGGVLLESCLNGSSEMVTNLSTAIVTYLFNIIMLKFLAEEGVAAITIVLYGQFLFNALYLGFSIGVAPVISYNYGSKNTEMLQRVYRICKIFTMISSVTVAIMALIGSPIIVEIFTPKGSATYEIARRGFFLFSFNYLFAGMNIFASGMFTALSNGKVSAIISFMRTFVFIVASIITLPYLLGVDGVWLAVPLAECLTIFISLYFFKSRQKQYGYVKNSMAAGASV